MHSPRRRGNSKTQGKTMRRNRENANHVGAVGRKAGGASTATAESHVTISIPHVFIYSVHMYLVVRTLNSRI